MKHQSTFYSQIDIELANIYSEDDWENLTSKTIKTNMGNLEVNIEKLNTSEFETEILQVEFQLQDLTKTSSLERSVYYE